MSASDRLAQLRAELAEVEIQAAHEARISALRDEAEASAADLLSRAGAAYEAAPAADDVAAVASRQVEAVLGVTIDPALWQLSGPIAETTVAGLALKAVVLGADCDLWANEFPISSLAALGAALAVA